MYLDEKVRMKMSNKALELFIEKFDSEVVNHKIENYFYKVTEAYKRRA